MRVEIRSLQGRLELYLDYLRDKIPNMDKHLTNMKYGDGTEQVLKDLEIEGLEDLANIFKDMDEPMGYAGHITFDATNGIVYILDNWIE